MASNTQRKKAGNVPFMDLTNAQQQEEAPKSTKGRGKAKIWDLELVTEDEQEIAHFLKEWTLSYTNTKGDYKVYRCNQSKQKLSSKRAAAKADLKRDRENKFRAATQINDEVDSNEEEEEPQPCPCQVRILKHQDTLKVSIYRSDDEHMGHAINNRVDGELYDRILELYESGVTKPSSIMHQ
jgi:hypothetical protein